MGGWAKWVMGIKEGACWDEHWVLYGSHFGNKLYSKKKERETNHKRLLNIENKLRVDRGREAERDFGKLSSLLQESKRYYIKTIKQ